MASLRKGNIIYFKQSNRKETIIKVLHANNPYMGMITTNRDEYSVDFLRRWEKMGFISIEKSNEKNK